MVNWAELRRIWSIHRAPDFHGDDAFTFTVSDGITTSAVATVSITVNSVNDLPVADEQVVTTSEESALSITLTGSDADSTSLGYAVLTQPMSGTLGGIAPNLIYTPNLNFNGSDSFTFQVSDGISESIALVSITVEPINDAPTAAAQTMNTDEDTPVAITLVGADVDGDRSAICCWSNRNMAHWVALRRIWSIHPVPTSMAATASPL